MNREGAETYLRLLAEAVLRRALAEGQELAGAGAADPGGHRTRLKLVGQALAAVGALDIGSIEAFLVDFNLAMAVRRIGDPRHGSARVSALTPHGQPLHQIPMAWAVRLGLGAPSGGAGPADPGGGPGRAPSGADPDDVAPEDGGTGRCIPVGLTVPFRGPDVSGELYLMSFTQTRTGARFFAVWNIRAPALRDVGLIPFDGFTVADDRGTRYSLDNTPAGNSGWTSEIGLRPAPPPGARWLDVAAPGSTAVRVDLRAADPGAAAEPAGDASPGETRITRTETSPGEHLLVMLAERLLTAVPDQPRDPWWRAPASAPPVLRAMAAGLGDIVAGLEAADALSPLSPVPAQLATLCASLDIPEHGITVPAAGRLPEPWLSVLAHYQRRKPDPVPLLEGYAAMTAALPELSGVQLTLLGLHHCEGGSSLHVLARGQLREAFLGPFGINPAFPLSIWLRDSGGRWHAARPSERYGGEPRDGEWTMRLQLVPPLTRATPWAEVRAADQTAEVRARLPVRWGYPS